MSIVKDLEKDLLNGRFDPKIPQLLIYGESEISGLEIFVVLEKITQGKEGWPGNNMQTLYSYHISGKGVNIEDKFFEIIKPDDTKEFIANDIAKFLEYMLKEGGAL